MAIAPKNPRKRAAKKTPKVKGEVSPETTPVASNTEVASPEEEKTKPVKKAAAVPVAIFQAAPIAEKNSAEKSAAEKAPAKKAPAKKSAPAKSEEPIVESTAAGESDSDSEDSSRGRRRRRGGRGRRKPGLTSISKWERVSMMRCWLALSSSSEKVGRTSFSDF